MKYRKRGCGLACARLRSLARILRTGNHEGHEGSRRKLENFETIYSCQSAQPALVKDTTHEIPQTELRDGLRAAAIFGPNS
jgi:hypothetical protein